MRATESGVRSEGNSASTVAPAGLSRRSALIGTTRAAGAAALGVLAVGITGCGRPEAPAAGGAPSKVIYLSQSAGGDAREEAERRLFEDFSKQHPNVQVEVVVGPGGWGPAKEKFVVSHAGGQPLDLTQNGWGPWTDLSEGGVILELTPLFKRDKINLADFLPAALDVYSLDGKTWALPVSVSADALLYSVDLFEAAGLAVPPVNPEERNWTTDKYLEVAQKLTRGDQFGFGGGVSSFNGHGFGTGTYFGQQPWDDQKRKAQLDTPPFITGLQYFVDLQHKWRVQPDAERAAALRGTLPNILYSGKIGMSVVGPFSPPRLQFRWALATLPYSGPGKNQSARMWPHGLHMGQVKDKEPAWSVLKWLARPEHGGRFPLTAGHSVSPLLKGGSDVAQKAYRDQHGVDPKAWALQAQYSRPSGNGILKYAKFPEIDRELVPMYRQVQENQMAVGEYGRRAVEIIQRVLGPPR